MKALFLQFSILILLFFSITTVFIYSQNTDNNNLNPVDFSKSKLLTNPNIKIVNLGAEVNTSSYDYAPTVTLDGKTIFFVSNREGSPKSSKNSHDFWAVKIIDSLSNKFDEPYNIDTSNRWGNLGLNTQLNEGAASISSDGKMIFFTGCDRLDGYGGCDIYFSYYDNGIWSKPKNLGSKINSSFWDSQPSIAPYNTRIYFTSNRPKNDKNVKIKNYDKDNNDFDIWYSDFDPDKNEWLPAKSLEGINTSHKECAPFICPDGSTLIFSSDAYTPNYGGLDFYVTKYDSKTNTWSKPQNLGTPLNSSQDDQFITIPANADILYFSSSRKDFTVAQGSLDLYMAYLGDHKYDNTNLFSENNWSYNYPNPFSNSTTINYKVTSTCNVEIKIFDIYGKELTTLVNKSHTPGEYQVVLSDKIGDNILPSGLYLYNIKFESEQVNHIEKKQMILVK